MGRMQYLMLSVIAMNIAFVIFSCGAWDPNTGACVPGSDMWTFLKNPFNVDSESFWVSFFGAAAGLASIIAGVLVVGAIFTRSTDILYIGMTLALISTVNIFIKFYTHILQFGAFGSPASRIVMAIIITSPMIITWLFVLLDWGRGRD